jgi:hypothetical protein
MNLMIGGKGGFISEEQQRRRSLAANKALNDRFKKDLEFYEKWKKICHQEFKKQWMRVE